MPELELSVDDLRAFSEKAGGFVFVHLRDADDGDKFMLDENSILGLHRFLGEVIAHYHLDVP